MHYGRPPLVLQALNFLFVDVFRQYVAISYDCEPSSGNSLSDSTLSATDEQRDDTAGLQREGYGDGNEDTMDEEERR